MGALAGGLACEFGAGGACGLVAGGGFCARAAAAVLNTMAAAKEIAGRGREKDFINAPVRLQSEKFFSGAAPGIQNPLCNRDRPKCLCCHSPTCCLVCRDYRYVV